MDRRRREDSVEAEMEGAGLEEEDSAVVAMAVEDSVGAEMEEEDSVAAALAEVEMEEVEQEVEERQLKQLFSVLMPRLHRHLLLL